MDPYSGDKTKTGYYQPKPQQEAAVEKQNEDPKGNPLAVLQFQPHGFARVSPEGGKVLDAANEVAFYHRPVGDQGERHVRLSGALVMFLAAICQEVPPGHERSTAISRAREAQMWASAGIALEPRPESEGDSEK